MAYFRRVKADFESSAAAAPAAYPPVGTYPDPVEHCTVCRWSPACRLRRRADDDLSLVAGIAARQRRALKERDVPTRRGLAGLPLRLAPPLDGTSRGAFTRVREQARIQVESEDEGRVKWEFLPLDRDEDGAPVADRGFLILPVPSPGDLFFDIEGDPFALDDGVDYLFGVLEPGLPGRQGRPDVPRDLEPRRGRRRDARGREARLRTARGPPDLASRRGPDAARLPLRRVRAHRPGPAGPAPRDARAGGRSPAPRRRAGGPVPRRPAGDPGGRRELLDQEAGAALRVRAGGRPAEREHEHRRVRELARGRRDRGGQGRRGDPARDRGLQPRRRGQHPAACATGSRTAASSSRRSWRSGSPDPRQAPTRRRRSR